MVLLGKVKLNTTEALIIITIIIIIIINHYYYYYFIFIIVINISYIIRDECVSVNNVLKEFYETEEKVKNPKTSVKYTI